MTQEKVIFCKTKPKTNQCAEKIVRAYEHGGCHGCPIVVGEAGFCNSSHENAEPRNKKHATRLARNFKTP
jgi:hypothetical protein